MFSSSGLKVIMKAYFCDPHTLFSTMTLSRLFYLFQIYACVVLMNVFSGYSLIQLRKQICSEKKQMGYYVKEHQILT